MNILVTVFIFISLFFNTSSTDAKNRELFKLKFPGAKYVDYEKYGKIIKPGTFNYVYKVTNKKGLADAQGEGIDPNRQVKEDPLYSKLMKKGRIKKNIWRHVNSDDPAADFFIWATAEKIDSGVKLFFTGIALENCGLYEHALKAYRAAMILFPDSYCWNRQNTWTWLIAPAAWDKIINITRIHPEIGLSLIDCYVFWQSAINGDPEKNKVGVTPGYFKQVTKKGPHKKRDLSKLKIVEQRGGKVSFVKYENGQWGMLVKGKPFFVKGVYYGPTMVGRDYTWNWMREDTNKNNINDVAYETWIDSNRNDKFDPNEKKMGDFAILKNLGCNAIRILNTLKINKELLRDLNSKYGIKVILVEPLGAYTIHSGASWSEGTDYTSRNQKLNMKKAVIEMVNNFKDEDWLLCYVLGNENNMPCDYTGVNATRTMASSQPKEYAVFLNEMAGLIHKMDPDHPVGVGNLGLRLLKYYNKYAKELDFIGVNEYSGNQGFGSLWIRAKKEFDRPVIIAEFGCDAYDTKMGLDETAQATYIENGWKDIVYNSAGFGGQGNCTGGVVFEFLDEWWNDTTGNPVYAHSKIPLKEMAFPDGYTQEEWLGIVSQGDGQNSPFLRKPREAFFTLRSLWIEK